MLKWLLGDRGTWRSRPESALPRPDVPPSPETAPAVKAEPPHDADRRLPARFLDDTLGSVVSIPALDFIGHYVRSPNGRYVLLWRDGADQGLRDGVRQRSPGRYYLVDGDRVVADGHLARPQDGKVADNGVFVLEDWKTPSSLSGAFLAFTPDGQRLVAREYSANIFNSGLSSDGRRAVCQTCNAPGSEDHSRLSIFDLESGVETGNCIPESGWASQYYFPVGEPVVRLRYQRGLVCDYGLDGRFIGRGAWVDAALKTNDLYLLDRLIRAEVAGLSIEMAARFLESLDAYLINASDADPRQHALALKLKGGCCEVLGRPEAALRAYERAVDLDPKIGLKRRVEQLRKQT